MPAVAPSLVRNVAVSNSSANQLLAANYAPGGIAGNNVMAAWVYANGRGTTVAIIDEGFDPSQFNSFSAASKGFGVPYLAATTATGTTPTHGQKVSSILAATDSSTNGPPGIAPYATVLAAGIDDTNSSWADCGTALEYSAATGHADVVNCSWGYIGFQGDVYTDPDMMPWFASVSRVVDTGRGGLGTTVVFSAGNDRAAGNDLGLQALEADPQVITVASTNPDGTVASYSTGGAALMTSAVGTGDVLQANGALWTVSATSAAAPIVSGIVDLMYSVNPALGWRDVQEIVAASSYAPVSSAGGFVTNGASGWNGGGMHFSNDLGFGVLDAVVAVNLARAWDTVSTSANLVETTVSSANTLRLAGSGTSATDQLVFTQNLRVEHVQVILGASALLVSHMTLVLVSPDGTRSVLLRQPGLQAGQDATGGMTLDSLDITSNAFWGENAAGTWSLIVQDSFGNDVGTLAGWGLKVTGDNAGVQAMPLIYTPEFATLATTGSPRTVVGNGGNPNIKTVDLIALDKKTVINLNGGAGFIDGVAVTVQSGLLNAKASGSTGDVTLTGTAGNNTLFGGDGTTVMNGGGGTDTITAGFGSTSVTTGAGRGRVSFANTLSGTNSTLTTGGVDSVTCGAGALAVTIGSGCTDIIAGGSGALVVNMPTVAAVNITQGSGDLTLNETGAAMVYGGSGNATITVALGNITWHGGSGALTFIGCGTAILSGGTGRETITMGTGGGTFTAGTGLVTYTGGSGTETVTSGAGGGTYVLSRGTSVFTGGSAYVTVNGGAGRATITGGSGGGVFTAGTAGNSVLKAGSGVAELHGTAAGDSLIASSAGGDKLYAGAGTQTLSGATSLLGNSFYNGSGNDTFTAGVGMDRFMFTAGHGATLNVINGFDATKDVIGLVGYGAGSASYAYAHQTADGQGGSMITLSDGLRIDVAGTTHLAQSAFA
jgi:subtilisin-like proprotein convertase family protein